MKMHHMILGIDPGMDGGIAAIKGNKVMFVQPLPTKSVAAQPGKKKRDFDLDELRNILSKTKKYNPLVYVEKVNSYNIPGRRVSNSSMFSFGRAFGILEGVLAGLSIPYRLVSAPEWKKQFLLIHRTKDDSIKKAKEIYPGVNLLFKRKKRDHDGAAESLLIMTYGALQEWQK